MNWYNIERILCYDTSIFLVVRRPFLFPARKDLPYIPLHSREAISAKNKY